MAGRFASPKPPKGEFFIRYFFFNPASRLTIRNVFHVFEPFFFSSLNAPAATFACLSATANLTPTTTPSTDLPNWLHLC
jgi:hypothetical protein